MAHFNVAPRYTCGSPAMVDHDTAERVAQEERTAYERALTGIYGEEDKLKAETMGLNGIAEAVTERRGGFDVIDMITGQHRRREETKAKNLRNGDVIRNGTDRYGNLINNVTVNKIAISDKIVVIEMSPLQIVLDANRDVKIERVI